MAFESVDRRPKRARGRPVVWGEPYHITTVKITATRFDHLKRLAKKDKRLTPTFLVNLAIDQLVAKEKADAPDDPGEIARILAERRENDRVARGVIGAGSA
jgi:hypothetical protein